MPRLRISPTPAAGFSSIPRGGVIKKILAVLFMLIVLIVAAGGYLWTFQRPHHSAPKTPPKPIVATGEPILDAIRRGAEYMKVHQESDGSFSKGILDPKPGFTAIAVDALARCPDKYREKDHEWLRKAAAYIVSKQNADGSISTPLFGLDTYTTAVSVMALTALENPAHAPVIEKAKNYLLSVQYRDDEEHANFGAPGYNKGGKSSGDLASMWIDALKDAGVQQDDPAFKNVQKFLSRLQNNPETNDKPAEGTVLGDDGGFFYRPGESKPADRKTSDGKRQLVSYGLMTYAGLKSFLYTGVDKNDPRIQSALKWVQSNFTLEENRNIGPDGLYYYYLTMAKALAVHGEKEIPTPQGPRNWARELSQKVIALQKADGSWTNSASERWGENDPILVTGYAMRTLTICHEFLKRETSQGAPAQP